MAKKKIKVVVNIPDKKYAAELKAKAMADIIAARIEKLPYEQQILVYDKIERLSKESEAKDKKVSSRRAYTTKEKYTDEVFQHPE